ncbi:MAG: sulfatase [Phycisphaerales bacterium]|jgi:arylsulfatase A-like enzyme|nr:sulfatase [Phycisphaerales bacterium]MBT7171922.1 sulfatase [Phycisphaerales bacterium]
MTAGSLAGAALTPSLLAEPKATEAKPNFIIVFVDDMGYGDVGCFGNKKAKTPVIDQMANEGMKFTSFYAQPVCGPSRSSIMTGCYPLRLARKHNEMATPHPRLHTKELTIAEVLKPQGYVSGCFGKWDLAGHSQTSYSPELLPRKQGFDYYFGTPSSNDSKVNLIRNEKVIEKNANMASLTKRYTDEAIGFIERNTDKPFFVYLPHSMVHVILAATKGFEGKSDSGLYGDCIEEIDSNLGRILKTLKRLKIEKNTYVIFTSDNGPWWLGGPKWQKKKSRGHSYGGVCGPLRGWKATTWEGGLRVPCVMWAPGKIPAGKTCSELTTTMDMLPTLAKLADTKAPTDRIIDGGDISGLMHATPGAKSPTEVFYYYTFTYLRAVRKGKYKLHIPAQPGDSMAKRWNKHSPKEDHVITGKSPVLYDLDADLGETTDIAAQHPMVVKELLALAEKARADIGDYNRIGKGARFFDPQKNRPDIERSGDAGGRPKRKKPQK